MLLEKVRESKGKKPFFALKCCGFAYGGGLSVHRDMSLGCRLAGKAAWDAGQVPFANPSTWSETSVFLPV
jgi:hypothetical protein